LWTYNPQSSNVRICEKQVARAISVVCSATKCSAICVWTEAVRTHYSIAEGKSKKIGDQKREMRHRSYSFILRVLILNKFYLLYYVIFTNHIIDFQPQNGRLELKLQYPHFGTQKGNGLLSTIPPQSSSSYWYSSISYVIDCGRTYCDLYHAFIECISLRFHFTFSVCRMFECLRTNRGFESTNLWRRTVRRIHDSTSNARIFEFAESKLISLVWELFVVVKRHHLFLPTDK
jgi:hypothetical protein